MEITDPPWDVPPSGDHWAVILLDEYAIKVPKLEAVTEEVEETAAIQNRLADSIDGCLPCEIIDDTYLVMPRAPGRPCDEIPGNQWHQASLQWDEIKEQARQLGYEIPDILKENVFWDGRQAYHIDYSHIRPIDHD